MKALARACAIGVLLGIAMAAGVGRTASAQGSPQKILVESSALKNDQPIPKNYTADGRNISPPLTWSNVPAGTREFAVILEDPDAGNPPPFVHWLIYKIPATAKGLPENIPIDPSAAMPSEVAGAIQGANGFRRNIYRGPAPPPGNPHHYHFIVYSLSEPLNLALGATRQQLVDAMKGRILGQGEIVPTYQRIGPAAPADPGGRGRGRGQP